MEKTIKKGVITRVGPKKTEFPNGSKITIGGKDGKPSYPGASIGVQFDFDKDVWYSGIVFEKQADVLKEGASVTVEVWDKQSPDGRVFKNYSLVSEKKANDKLLVERLDKIESEIVNIKRQLVALSSNSTTQESTPVVLSSSETDIDKYQEEFMSLGGDIDYTSVVDEEINF